MDVVGTPCPQCSGELMAERMPLTGQTRDRCGRCGFTQLHRPMRIGDPAAHAEVVRVAQASARAPREMPAPMGFTDEALADLRAKRTGTAPLVSPFTPVEELPGVAAVRRRRQAGMCPGRPGHPGPRHHKPGALQEAVLDAVPACEAEAAPQEALVERLAAVLAHSALPQRLLGQTLLRLHTRGLVARKPIGGRERKRWAYWRAA